VLVLPLDVLGDEPGLQNFGSGLTDEIAAQVGSAAPERVGVISRATSWWCKQSRKPVDQLAREIGADSVLEGSVRYAGGQMRITTQLSAGKDQTSVWTGTYESQFTDASIAVQRDIAGRIAESVVTKLVPDVLVGPLHTNPTAKSAQDMLAP